jgi:hypothetical protein
MLLPPYLSLFLSLPTQEYNSTCNGRPYPDSWIYIIVHVSPLLDISMIGALLFVPNTAWRHGCTYITVYAFTEFVKRWSEQ